MRKKRENQYVTIKTVAKEAKVSTATVSRVINGGKVKADKKKAVLEAIKYLNYTPNNSARNLASVKTTKRVSLVIPKLSPSYIDLIQGFKEGLKIYKYEAIIEEFYNSEKIYEDLSDIHERTSEIKGIVQFAPKKDLINKVIFSVLDDHVDTLIPDIYNEKKIAIFIPQDKYLAILYLNSIFPNASKYKAGKKYDCVIVEKIDEALKLYNDGYKGEIKIIEKTENITEIFKNMSTLDVDMYKFGIYLSRYIIKQIIEVDTDQPLIEIK